MDASSLAPPLAGLDAGRDVFGGLLSDLLFLVPYSYATAIIEAEQLSV